MSGKWHELKIWPNFFAAVLMGDKTFEVRKADRQFCVSDYLVLTEFDPERKEYTGRQLTVIVTYLMNGGIFGLDADYVVMGIKKP